MPDTGIDAELDGVSLSAQESAALVDALAAAGLTGPDRAAWDSLDVATVLTVVESELGVQLDGSRFAPRQVTDVRALTELIARCGRRTPPPARLRLRLASGSPWPGRTTEYRLGLAAPRLRTAVSRSEPLDVHILADQPGELPLVPEVLAALGLPVPAEGAQVRSAPTVTVPDVAPLHSGPAADVLETVAGCVREFVRAHGHTPLGSPSPVVPTGHLRALGYLEAHPEQVFALTGDSALLPAACLRTYGQLTAEVRAVTFEATVFRRERHYCDRAGRLPAFTCREVVWHGDDRDCAERFEQAVDLFERVAAALGLRSAWHRASDPFFLAGAGDGRKVELRARVGDGDIAVGSVNAHGRHFTGRGYGVQGWATGCAGLGLERLVLAAGR
jgi:hypothetical protein